MDQYISMISDRKIFHLKIVLTHIYFPFLPFIIMKITIGAPKIEVTVLIFSSSGANAIRAIRSHPIQNTPRPGMLPVSQPAVLPSREDA